MDNNEVNQTPAGREALRIIATLKQNGHTAFLAGGCVRDALLNLPVKDFDVATEATPPEVRRIFGRGRTLAIGESFGVIAVLPTGRDSGLPPTEVATFRSDGSYSDGRRPDSVQYGDDRADALRRDFTINGMFYDPAEERIIDHVGGIDDLHAGVLRTIGSATRRFAEDQLRMLRAIRFATTKLMSIDSATFQAIGTCSANIATVSEERIGQEMRRLIADRRRCDGLRLLIRSGLATHVWPGLEEGQIDAAEKRILEDSDLSPVVALAALLLDREDADGQLRTLAKRWRLSNAERDRVGFAIEGVSMFRRSNELPWHQLQPVLVHRFVDDAVQLAGAVCEASLIGQVNEWLSLDRETLDPPPLIDGGDLKALGVPAGPVYRTVLEKVRRMQLDGEIPGRAEALKVVQQEMPRDR